jgi:hypothetical protein
MKTGPDGYVRWIQVTNLTLTMDETIYRTANITVWKSEWNFTNSSRDVNISATTTEEFVGVPEFGESMLPLLAVPMLFIVFQGMKRKRRPPLKQLAPGNSAGGGPGE